MSASEKSLEVGMFASQPVRVINPFPAKPRVGVKWRMGLSGVPRQCYTMQGGVWGLHGNAASTVRSPPRAEEGT